MRHVRDKRALSLVTSAVWRGEVREATTDELLPALAVARRNQVQGRLARAYPHQLGQVLADVEVSSGLLRRNLSEVTGRLGAAGVPSVLIKCDPAGDNVYGNFDLVIRQREWARAFSALAGWYVHSSVHWLERTGKVLLYPQVGPALHLHNGVTWFGVPVVTADRLLSRAEPGDGGWQVPAPADALRIWLAHALFQNLSLDLSELFAIRGLLTPELVAAARAEAAREGWAAGFEGTLATAQEAIGRLSRAAPVALPVALPATLSLRAAAEHARYLYARGLPRVAARELALRVPLLAAKRRRVLTG